ncbi:hypothetical protein BCV70DRAFT_91601 [Testicularia cyperi]|uniref:PIPK domain-containing protein n=1 Tax=Testicularia cyperi TaxID=1882483 RepID=A0A317XSF1_9BASI|nr:hypothetical protein BCV70DRAFT_91601 [Testicularia cyperi]
MSTDTPRASRVTRFSPTHTPRQMHGDLPGRLRAQDTPSSPVSAASISPSRLDQPFGSPRGRASPRASRTGPVTASSPRIATTGGLAGHRGQPLPGGAPATPVKTLSSPSGTASASPSDTQISPSAKSTSSNWQASIELSLTTRRRLIRKPLPQLPSQTASDPQSTGPSSSDYLHPDALEAIAKRAEEWWPTELPEKRHAGQPSRDGKPTQSQILAPGQEQGGDGLDDQSIRHLLAILHYAALRDPDSSAVCVSATGTYKQASSSSAAASSSKSTSTKQPLYVLDDDILDSLFAALQDAMRHLSKREVLGSLQRTASIRWRAEAQLRNASAALAAESSQAPSSRWARFAWPAAALGRAYRDAQRNILPPLPGDTDVIGSGGVSSSGSYFHSNQDLWTTYPHPDHEQRIRKRDVAIKILSNAVWFVRNYGPLAGAEGISSPAVLNEIDSTAVATATAVTEENGGDEYLRSAPASVRRTSENLLKKNAGLPNFLSKSSATTALSGNATPESAPSDSNNPSAPASEASSLRGIPTSPGAPVAQSKDSGSESVLMNRSSSSSTAATAADAVIGTSVAATTTTTDATGTVVAPDSISMRASDAPSEKSKAMEHLASLSAAAGAALKQRAQQDAVKGAGLPDASLGPSASLRPQASRPSLRSFVSRSEAEAAETDALERAEKEYLAKVGRGCDEWAKMALCRICASIEVAQPSLNQSHRRRSGTITAKDFGGRNPVAAASANQDEMAGSGISTRSDMTARAARQRAAHTRSGSGDHDRIASSDSDEESQETRGRAVVWRPDRFKGDELFLQGVSVAQQRRKSHSSSHTDASEGQGLGIARRKDEDEHVRLVGGTFRCRVETERERDTLLALLELAVYVGSSMLLESSFLRDSDAARPKVLKVPSRTTSAVDTPQRGTSLVRQPSLASSLAQNHSSRDQTPSVRPSMEESRTAEALQPIATQSLASAGTDTSENRSQPMGGARRWTKSLWGMLSHAENDSSSGADPATQSVRPSTSSGAEATTMVSQKSSRPSLTLNRSNTEDERQAMPSVSRKVSTGFPRSKTITGGKDEQQQPLPSSLSISSRRTSLVSGLASISTAHPSSTNVTRHGREGSSDSANVASGTQTRAPNRFVGRLFNAFVKPSADSAAAASSAAIGGSTASSATVDPAQLRDRFPSQGTTSDGNDAGRPEPRSKDTVFARMLGGRRKASGPPPPPSHFPCKDVGPAPLSSSPELSMLLCYRQSDSGQHGTNQDSMTSAYMFAFARMQAMRFLADQRRDLVTFATPSHGISLSGDLLPYAGVHQALTAGAINDGSVRSVQSRSVSIRSAASIAPQLLSYDVRSTTGQTLSLRRETVAFYQRLSNSRDVPLGQLIEELGVRASTLEADDASEEDKQATGAQANGVKPGMSKTSKEGAKERNDAASASAGSVRNRAYGTPEQSLQYLHGSYRIKIIATVLPKSLYERAQELDGDTKTSRDAIGTPHAESPEGDNIDRVSNGADDPVSPSLRPTRSRESDVSAIAAAVHADRDAATTAFAVAETAVQAAESGTRPLVSGKGGSASGIWMWNASATSGWQGRAVPMSESTYLMSFARYLEAITYHPALRRAGGLEPSNRKLYGGLTNVQEQLRQGRSEDTRSIAEGNQLLRLFRAGRALVKVQVQPIVMYDLQIEGPCLHSKPPLAPHQKRLSPIERKKVRKEQRIQQDAELLKSMTETTRLEVQCFFASVKAQTTRLEDIFVARELDEAGRTIRKRPSLFSFGEDGGLDEEKTQAGVASTKIDADRGSAFSSASGVSTATASSSSTISGIVAEPLTLLAGLRSSFRADEFELYEALQRNLFFDTINDVRKAFADRAKSARNRLNAWIKKHLSKKEQAQLDGYVLDEPEYLQPGRHAFPGSCYLIRENEPLSIVAFSLSSRDFRTEIGTLQRDEEERRGYFGQNSINGSSSSYNDQNVLNWRSGIVDGQSTIGSQISSSTGSSISTSTSPLRERAMRKVPLSQLDPDADEVFYEPEPVQAALKRKKRGREASILSLTLRRVGSTISESRSNLTTPTSEVPPTPSSAAGATSGLYDVDASNDKGKEERSSADDFFDADSSINSDVDATATTHRAGALSQRTSELHSQSSFTSVPDRKSSIQQYQTTTLSSNATDSTFRVEVVPVSGRPVSLASLFPASKLVSEGGNGARTADSRSTTGSTSCANAAQAKTDMPPPPPPAQSSTKAAMGQSSASMTTSSAACSPFWTVGHSGQQGARPSAKDSSHRAAALQSASEGTPAADAQSMVSTSTLPGSTAAESPHIKHNLIHGSTKISCVSWFAEEFAALRARWGVEHDFAQSLARCQPWNTTGGKSKSAFFKTADERFIAKQLLTVWSVDEKEAFLEFAPAYIRYMMNSVVNDCPTLLVKIAGVYSIKIKDIKSGETKLKMNVMVLENLWAGDGGQSIRFDLKGIRDRKVKLSPQQQQNLQQSATTAAMSGKPLINVPGTTNGAPAQSSMTAIWSAGVQTIPSKAERPGSSASTRAGGLSSNDLGPSSANGRVHFDQSQRGGNSSNVSEKLKADAQGGSAAKKDEERSSTVWWDSEWIERYRHRAFVPETQKEVFYRALQNDTQFLTASNVMDYSLLLGVMEKPVRPQDLYPAAATTAAAAAAAASPSDKKEPISPSKSRRSLSSLRDDEKDDEEHDPELDDERPSRPSFRCRIVDFLGAFTLAKQLESSSKKALKTGQEAKGNVTILPPSEYASRFLTAMDTYFIGTPCHPRLDPGYAFDEQCLHEAAAAKAAAPPDPSSSTSSSPYDSRPRFSAVF